ncbi:MAG TPA: dUTP diphosphatase [bacterium]|nr:dUTP diphosphatase [bacterium]HPL95526.1 dUTP diphosphatase [bacterium]
MKLKFKKIYSDAMVPTYGRAGDAGMDLYSYEDKELLPGERYTFKTGVAVEIPENFVMVFWDRSGLAVKHGLTVLAGVIDSNFRGEMGVCVLNTSNEEYQIKKGDRIAQFLVQPVEKIELEEADELSETNRGEKWQASSGY